ncbi:DUF1963 domain-containing protein [Streptomyces sp. NPDC050658]|uniref:DUF1963 domain-containing protein n=1 Tax=unclassified Streptomyces TaxID=2593676 RepID=UPI00342DED0C
MPRHTPPRPLDVEELFPEVVPFRRETVRLHPRAGEPTHRDSSVGGPLLWPEREPWPVCPTHEASPMVPVVQIYRSDMPDAVRSPFPDGCDLLQVLWCPLEHAGEWVVPHIRCRASDAVGAPAGPPPVPSAARRGRVPRPCVVHPEQVTEYASWDLPSEVRDVLEKRFEEVEAATGWDYQYHLSTAPGIKLGGWPGWSQEPAWPRCTQCRRPMEHLLTVESWEADAESGLTWTPVEDRGRRYDGPDLMLGDAGGVYLFVCTACPDRPYTHRFDCA